MLFVLASGARDAFSHAGVEHGADTQTLSTSPTSSWFTSLPWSFEPWVVCLMLVTALLYAAGVTRMWRHAGAGRGITRMQASLFAAGMLALACALLSPLDTFGARLFSAHMIQHELLMLVAAPLFVLSRPLAAWSWALPHRSRSSLPSFTRNTAVAIPWHAMTAPLGAWVLHAAALWAWHLPVLMALALENDGWHAAQHASFFVTALLFWWSTIGGDARGSKRSVAFLSLFTTMIHTGALGALLTFASSAWYPAYATTTAAFGIDALDDQQLGGLVMWIPGGVAYIVAALAMIGRMLGRDHETPHATTIGNTNLAEATRGTSRERQRPAAPATSSNLTLS